MNARIWQAVVLCNAMLALGWSLWCWQHSPILALAGFVWPFMVVALHLGSQMLLMRGVCAQRSLLLPPAVVLVRAWANEWLLSLQVFGWRMPFRAQAEADGWSCSPQQPVGLVLVHGYFCNRAVWAPWLRKLKKLGIACTAVTLEPAQGAPMDAMVADLAASVQRMMKATGRAPLIVAHSMGGLVVRAWLNTLSAEQQVAQAAHVITVATPHRGAWLARFARRLPARDMREGSDWIDRLGWPPDAVRFSCWASRSDNIVFPPDLALLPGAEQHLLEDVAHMQLLFDERLWRACLQTHAQLCLQEAV
ncbi:MAG: alpha/beta fold hydrolase [Comamonas sp.]